MEYLNQINKRGKVIGSVSREEAHEKFILHEAVQVFVFDDKGRVLVQKRSKKKDVFPGYYEIGVSGHVAFEEGIKESAKRELKEEVKIELKGKELKKIGSFRVREKPENEVMFLFVLDNFKGKIKMDKKEVDWVKFVKLKKLKKMIEKKKFTPASLKGWILFQNKH